MAICAYCLKDRELCQSHALPDGFFRAISRKNSGQLIHMTNDPDKIKRSQNSGKSPLLCKDCEALFNKQFDAQLVNALMGWDNRIQAEGFNVRYDFCPNHLAQCFASVCWRASVSSNKLYVNSKVNWDDNVFLLSLINGPRKDVLKNCSCSIHRVYDKRSANEGGFSQSAMAQMILLPH